MEGTHAWWDSNVSMAAAYKLKTGVETGIYTFIKYDNYNPTNYDSSRKRTDMSYIHLLLDTVQYLFLRIW